MEDDMQLCQEDINIYISDKREARVKIYPDTLSSEWEDSVCVWKETLAVVYLVMFLALTHIKTPSS